MAQPQPQQIALTDLNLTQLSDVKRQLEEELNHLTNSFAQLKAAQAKFTNCIENVKELGGKNADKSILVPLTNSLYVSGKICDPDHVIVDIGTGYFVQKTRPEAIKYYNEKILFITSNIGTLEETIVRKKDNSATVVQVMREKLQAEAKAEGKAVAGATEKDKD